MTATKAFLAVNILLFIYLSYYLLPGSSDYNTEEKITSNLLKDSDIRRSLLQDNYYHDGEHDKRRNCDCSKCPSKPVIIESNDLGKRFNQNGSSFSQNSGITNRKRMLVKVGQDRDLSKSFQVPNIVHYIWYNTKRAPFKFHQMLSVMSADKFIKPDVIYFHTDNEPTGEFWERTKKISRLKIIKRNPPTRLFGEDVKPPKFYTSHSNVDRVKVLMEYGGIYLDFDVFAIRSFDELRKHVCTIGFESEKKSCGSIIICSKDAFFLILWINSYFDDYRADEWAYNTGKVPFNLARRYPHLVHVERTKLNRPNFNELNLLYGDRKWNWNEHYAVHTWYRLWKDWSGMFKGVEPNITNINTLNNTFGEIARKILYD